MKNQYISVLAALLLSPGLASCVTFGSGKIEKKTFAITDPTEVEVCCGFEVTVEQTAEPYLRVSADDNLFDDLRVDEDGGKLRVLFPESVGGYAPSQRIEVAIGLVDLRKFVGSGGNDVLVRGFTTNDVAMDISGGASLVVEGMRASSFALEMSGGGEATLLDLELDELRFNSSGGGSVEAQGKASRLFGELSGGGRLTAHECRADNVTLELSGGADATVHAEGTLTVSASSGGEVRYEGQPRLDLDLSGGSSVDER